jgi:hypothetical protein
MSNALRSIARGKAKVNMKSIGMTGICKNGFFAKHWKEFVKTTPAMKKGRR